MSDHCFTDVRDGTQYRVAIIYENQSGYHPLGKAKPDDPHELDKWVGDKEEVRAKVNMMNKHLNIDEDREREIRFSTMQEVLGVDEDYDEDYDHEYEVGLTLEARAKGDKND
jgi:hypothetical protein